MMRRISTVGIAVLIVLMFGMTVGAANGPLVEANLTSSDPTGGGYCSSFTGEVPGNWGGEPGDGAVTAFPGDDDDAGYCSFTWPEGKARRIELRVLDGLADDSFAVYVKNPAGKWVLTYSYSDQYATETWLVHTIEGFPAGKGQGAHLDLMIVPTNVGWSGFNTYGQLAVDTVALYEH